MQQTPRSGLPWSWYQHWWVVPGGIMLGCILAALALGPSEKAVRGVIWSTPTLAG